MSSPDSSQLLLRVSEVARVLGISRQRAYQLVADGTLPHTRIGPRTIRIPRAALEAWLAVHAERSVDALRAQPVHTTTDRAS